MTPDQWKRIRPLLDEFLELDLEERKVRLTQLAAEDPDLSVNLANLLSAHHDPPSLLAKPLSGLPNNLELPEDHTDDRLGSSIGGYRLVKRIGEGGMATVYLAEREDGGFDQRVAMKIIRPGMANDSLKRRFRGEQQILASLNHPNVARLYGGGLTEDGVPYIVMELVEGKSLTQYCDHENLDLNRRLSLFISVCSAVEYAHQNLVVHRDIKPSNIYVNSRGEIKLLDFGVAKLLEEESEIPVDGTLTALYGTPLTPAYAAPEQMLGQSVTTAADVYALGVVLGELISGIRPGNAASMSRSMSRSDFSSRVSEKPLERPSTRLRQHAHNEGDLHSAEEIARLRGLTPARLVHLLEGDLDNIVLMALRAEPARRYSSVALLREDIENHLANRPVRARPESWSYLASRFVRRHRLAVVLVGAGLLALMVGLTAAISGQRAARREARTSDQVSQFLVDLFRGSDPTYGRDTTVSAQDLLEEAASRIDTQLASEPEVKARLLLVIGESFAGLGAFDRAIDLVRQGIETMEQYESSDPDLLGAQGQLAACYREAGRFEEAEKLFEELLGRLSNSTLDGETEATILNDYGLLCQEKGEGDRAESFYRQALDIRRRDGIEETQQGARTLNNLAMSLSYRQDHREAETLVREVLRIQRIHLTEPHVDIISSLNNLATIQRQLGDLDQAEELFTYALDQRRKLLGEEHPDVAQSFNNLGTLRYYRGELDGAEEYLEKAHAIWSGAFDGDHQRLVAVLSNLGAIHRKQQEFDPAVSYFQRAAEMQERLQGSDNPNAALAHYRWGACLLESGQPQEAREHLDRAFETQRSTLGQNHRHTVRTVIALAGALSALDEPQRAVEILQETHTSVQDQEDLRLQVEEAQEELFGFVALPE